MDENKNRDVDQGSVSVNERRPFRTPTLRTLGNVQSVVQHGGDTNGDGGTPGNSNS